ncbi:MAG: EF-hand domain-containing protein [Paracoccaceae bacterium]
MKKKLKYSVAILLAFTVGTTVVAQTPKGMKMLGMSDFEDFDIDKDGKVSKEEIRERRGVAVQLMDLNGDAKLSAGELMQQHTKRAEFSVNRMIKKLDSNGDGSLSFAELENSQLVGTLRKRFGKRFDRLDKDDDGYISRDEALRVKKNMRKLLKR